MGAVVGFLIIGVIIVVVSMISKARTAARQHAVEATPSIVTISTGPMSPVTAQQHVKIAAGHAGFTVGGVFDNQVFVDDRKGLQMQVTIRCEADRTSLVLQRRSVRMVGGRPIKVGRQDVLADALRRQFA